MTQELSRIGEAKTIGDILHSSNEALHHLRSLGIFESADVLIDSSPTEGPNGPQADVVIKVVETKRLTQASTGVSTQSGEGSMDTKVSVRNIFGWAEQINFEMELGQQKSNAFRLAASKPRLFGTNTALTADVTKSAISHLKHSSFVEKLLGGSVSARMGEASDRFGAHELTGSLNLRDVCQLEKGVASWPILQQRGMSLKSAITHTFSLSSLDNPVVPERGASLKLTTELAGVTPPIGDVKFIKHDLTASAFTPLLHPRVSLGASVHAGLLLPVGSCYGQESHVCDRFFLGGPGSLWGFRTRGVGPRELRHSPTGEGAHGPSAPRDSLGGDVMAVGTARLSVRLPGKKLEEANVRAHAFASAGGLQSLAQLNSDGSFFPSLRACVGVGLAIPTALGRVELNLTHVTKRRSDDAVVRSGLQIGVMPPS